MSKSLFSRRKFLGTAAGLTAAAMVPNLQALVHGPVAMFAVGQVPASVRAQELLAAAPVAGGSTDWRAKTAAGDLTLWPFTAIRDEHYRLYQQTEA